MLYLSGYLSNKRVKLIHIENKLNFGTFVPTMIEIIKIYNKI